MRRSVLVTGASSGIGRVTVLHLSEIGFHAIGSVRTREDAADLRDEAARAGLGVDVVVFDVTDAQASECVMTDLELYGLVNNAGYYNVGAVTDVPLEEAERQLEAMMIAPIRLAKLALPTMHDRGQGRIVNVSSGILYRTAALTGWYQAAKHALSAVSDALRMEVAHLGVEVVLVEPGGIDTEIWRKAEDDLMRRRPGSRYTTAYDRALTLLQTLHGRMHPAHDAAAVIGEALTAGRPRQRYRVGREVAALEAANLLIPSALRDRMVRAFLGL